MNSTTDFSKVKTVFFPLSVPADALLDRAVEYIDRFGDKDAGQTIADLMAALAQLDGFDVQDFALLDDLGRQIGLGLIYHAFHSGRLTPEMIGEALEQIRKHKIAQHLTWRV